jgi:hypothetical protein
MCEYIGLVNTNRVKLDDKTKQDYWLIIMKNNIKNK